MASRSTRSCASWLPTRHSISLSDIAHPAADTRRPASLKIARPRACRSRPSSTLPRQERNAPTTRRAEASEIENGVASASACSARGRPTSIGVGPRKSALMIMFPSSTSNRRAPAASAYPSPRSQASWASRA